MGTQVESPQRTGYDYVSTGHLPSPEVVKTLMAEAYERFKSNVGGRNSDVYPALARVPSDLFGACVVGTNGHVYAVGDTEYAFSIMSVNDGAIRVRMHWSAALRDEDVSIVRAFTAKLA